MPTSPGGLPLVVCPDGSVLGNPSEQALSRQIGLTVASRSNFVYDVAVVGAGPAGLSTAVYGCSEGLSVAVLDARRFRRPGRRQRQDRKLLWLSDRNQRPGAHRPRLRSGAEIRRRRHDPGRRQDARLLARQRRVRPRDGRRRAHSGPDDRRRQRRALSPSDDRRYRPVRGPRNLVLGLADRSAPVRRRRGHSGRRRQFGRSGRGVSLRPRLQGAHDGAEGRALPKACRAI